MKPKVVQVTDRAEVRIQVTEWQGREGLDIRRYVVNGNGDTVPTPQGVRIDINRVDVMRDVIKGLTEIVDEIEAAVPDEIKVRKATLEDMQAEIARLRALADSK